jgi:hydrogenase small subunit
MKTLPIVTGEACTASQLQVLRTAGRLSRRQILQGGLCAAALLTIEFGTAGCSSSKSEGKNANSVDGLYSPSGRPKSDAISDSRIPIIWIEAGVCTGCAISLLGNVNPTIEALLPYLRLEFQETLMDGAGPSAVDRLLAVSSALSGQFILIVDGSVSFDATSDMTILGATSTGFDITAQELIDQLASRSLAVVALGTCASFGGIPAAAPNPGGHASIARLVPPGKPFVRLPGCPPNPAWIVELLGTVMTQGLSALSLDSLGRPLSAYGGVIHDVCPRRDSFNRGEFAQTPGDPSRCLITVGCKGPDTHADCPKRLWNGRSTCINANHPCMGCASPGFPDARADFGPEGQVASSPFYLDP